VATTVSPTNPTQRRPRRSLAPREHGAYGQLGLPLLTALILAEVALPALLITLVAVLGFLAHEPAAVWLGLRGPRIRREDGGRALRMVLTLGLGLLASGTAAFLLAPALARAALLVLALLSAGTLVILLKDRHNSLGGDLLAAVTLSGWSLPVALAGSAETSAAVALWLCWTLGFALATLAVHQVLAHNKGKARPAAAVAITALSLLVFAALLASARGQALPSMAAFGFLPLGLISVVLAHLPPPAKQIRRVGWQLMAAGVLTAVLLLAFS
jgi:hypothetical protein